MARPSSDPGKSGLAQIAARMDTNKGRSRAGGRPPLAEVYEPYLGPLRDRARSVLEIGIERGGSLRLWAEYFGDARIWGVDVKPATEAHAGDRIAVRIGDQGDAAFLDSLAAEAGPFDLVVDDGSHRFDHQRETLLRLWPHLSIGGVYVVEDVHTSYRPKYGGALGRSGSFIEFAKGLIDDVHFKEHKGPVALPGLQELHVHFQTLVLRKGPVPKRLADRA